MINTGLLKLPLDSGPKLAVGQLACCSGLPGGSSSRGKLYMLSYHSCYIIGLGRAYRLGEIF